MAMPFSPPHPRLFHLVEAGGVTLGLEEQRSLPMPHQLNPKERMTASELLSFEADFHAHFRLNDAKLSPLRNTRTYWPWAKALDLMKEQNVQVEGVYINYGLAEGRFIPVLEFYSKDASGALVHKPDAAYVYGLDQFHKIKDSERKSLVDAYLTGVLVKRKATDTSFVALRDQATPKDPRGIWYGLTNKLAHLLGGNPIVEDRWLAVSCISAEMNYSDMMPFLDEPEFRHLLALHVARPKLIRGTMVLVDLLDDQDDGSFALKAMDLGNVCPPNCTSGRP